MDAFLETVRVTMAYAAIGYLGLMTAAGLWVSQHPDTAIVVTAVTFVLLVYQYGKQMRNFVKVFLIWPPVRWYHRLIRKPVRYITGGIMARWKRAVVADEIDDRLSKLCYEQGIISKQEYRRMSTLIGQALGLTDLVAKKKHPIGVCQRVLTNIAMLKGVSIESVAATYQGLKRKPKVKAEVKPTLNYLNKRRNAA